MSAEKRKGKKHNMWSIAWYFSMLPLVVQGMNCFRIFSFSSSHQKHVAFTLAINRSTQSYYKTSDICMERLIRGDDVFVIVRRRFFFDNEESEWCSPKNRNKKFKKHKNVFFDNEESEWWSLPDHNPVSRFDWLHRQIQYKNEIASTEIDTRHYLNLILYYLNNVLLRQWNWFYDIGAGDANASSISTVLKPHA